MPLPFSVSAYGQPTLVMYIQPPRMRVVIVPNGAAMMSLPMFDRCLSASGTMIVKPTKYVSDDAIHRAVVVQIVSEC